MFIFWVHYNLTQTIHQHSTQSVLTTCFEPKQFIPKWHYTVGYDLTFLTQWSGCNTINFSFFFIFNFVVKLVFQVSVMETQNLVTNYRQLSQSLDCPWEGINWLKTNKIFFYIKYNKIQYVNNKKKRIKTSNNVTSWRHNNIKCGMIRHSVKEIRQQKEH